MKRPTEADYLILKSQAQALCGCDEVEDTEFEEADYFGVVRHCTVREFWDYLDAALAKKPDCATTLALKCTLWPTRADLMAAVNRRAFLAHRIVEVIEEIVGGAAIRAKHAFDAKTPDGLLDDLGIPKEFAKDLLSRHPGRGQMAIVEHETGVAIVRGPSDGERKLWKEAWDGGQKGRACLDLACAAVLFPSEDERRARFERFPALPYGLLDIILDCGGAGEKAKRKKH